jgi:hypothetical protein
MSRFVNDIKQETILAEYLDMIYKNKNLDFSRVFDLSLQHKGIDVIMFVKSNDYYIDEKAQLHYLNSDLPTFTFELTYLLNSKSKIGWLFDTQKVTQYYFLITGIILKNGISILSKASDIEKVKITSVHRQLLIDNLNSKGLSEQNLLEYCEAIRVTESFGKNEIKELHPYNEGVIYFSEHLSEKPINIQLRLGYLLKEKIAKKFHYV